MDTGIDGIALSGSVLRADDPIDEMRQIKEILIRKH
jgi:thiamine monophosphate synthase